MVHVRECEPGDARRVQQCFEELAEASSRQRGSSVIRPDVLAGNRTARALYGRTGYRDLEIGMTRKL